MSTAFAVGAPSESKHGRSETQHNTRDNQQNSRKPKTSHLQSLPEPHAVGEDAAVPVGPLAALLELRDVHDEVVVHELDPLHLRYHRRKRKRKRRRTSR